MYDFNSIISVIRECGIIPVIKINDHLSAVDLSNALYCGGINCIEITMRTANADKAIGLISKELPEIYVGAGTVLNINQAQSAIKMGAKFIVTPGFNDEVIDFCLREGITVIPGCNSTYAIEAALKRELKYLKFFPAEQSGGVSMLRALKSPYSEIFFMPTGGVNQENIGDYLACENVFACGGSWIASEGMIDRKEFKEIELKAREAVNLIKRVRD